MASLKGARTGDVGAFLRATKTVIPIDSQPHFQRTMLAQWCRWIGKQLGQNMASKLPVKLSPRLKETLELLLAGNSEKEVAAKMGISTHTVHVHVKTLHKRLGVSSRGELLSRFVNNDGQVDSSALERSATRIKRPKSASKTKMPQRKR
jgi:DNA-binding CsgD family transcriptional regulator